MEDDSDRTGEDYSGGQQKQQRALRAIEVVAISGFVKYNRRLKESCLVICNSCRECLQERCLTLGVWTPRTLLAVFWPGELGAKSESASRVLFPRRVLKVEWTFNDRATPDVVKGEEEEEDKDEEEGDEKDEEKEENEEEEEEEEEEETNANAEEEYIEKRERGEEQQQEEKQEEKEEDVEDDTTVKEDDITKEDKAERGPETACDIDLIKVRWPKGVREIHFFCFNRSLDMVPWPDTLQILSFHMPCLLNGRGAYHSWRGIFNRPLDGVAFPVGLREISLGFEFNQPITGVTWPEGLKRLTMPGFNQPIRDVQWPPRLEILEFIKPDEFEHRQSPNRIPWNYYFGRFNQPLGIFLPVSLETLWLSDSFDQSLRGVTWPSALAVLGLGRRVSQQSIDGITWPPSLRKLVYSDDMLDIPDAPSGCEVVLLGPYDDISSDEDDESGAQSMDDVPDEDNYDYADSDYESS